MKNIIVKLFSLSLVFMLLLTSVGANRVSAEGEDQDGVELSWEVIENDPDRLAKKRKTVEEPDGSDEALTGDVRVSILLEKESTIASGYATEGIGLNPGAIAYRDSLKKQQDDIATAISKQALDGEELNVVWNLTLAANIISAVVPAEKIDAIKAVNGVKDVYVEMQYTPDVYSRESDNPNMSTASDMVTAQYAWADGYTGAGSKIAIVDTGLDLEHQSFDPKAFEMSIAQLEAKTGKEFTLMKKSDVTKLWADTNAYARSGGKAADAYKNSKVPFGYNYVDNDFDVTHMNDTQEEHGSHVASIAAGNRYIYTEDEEGNIKLSNALSTVHTQGNAPDAQLFVMKVFGKGGGAYDSDYFAAIEDAIWLGADTVNLSLGSSVAGFTRNNVYKDIINDLKDTDIVWANSAGNNSYWAEQSYTMYPYSDDVNFATGGSPATYPTTMSVASVDNKGFTGYYLEFNGELIFYTESSFSNQPISTITGEHEFVYVDAVGTTADFNAVRNMLRGKIALCNRGSTSFYEKATAAVRAGAIATIVVNNQPGTISMDLSDYRNTQPVVSITLDDGNYIKENSEMQTVGQLNVYTGTITVGDTIGVDQGSDDSYTMSSFSSFGVPGDLSMKPEITTPGGNIYAVNGMHISRTTQAVAGGHDTYENMSGTSMASPQMAGLVALMSQYYRDNELEATAQKVGLSKRGLIQSLLMSTAKPLIEQATGNYYSVMNQGSGLADVSAAMNSNIVITVDDTKVNGVSKMNAAATGKDGKVKAELGDDPERTGLYTVEFTIHNIADHQIGFNLDESFFTQDIFEDGDFSYLDTWTAELHPSVTWYVDGETEESELKYNFDEDELGVYDENDAQAILDYVIGNRETIGDMEYADFDLDGSITTYDAYLALKLSNRASVEVAAGEDVKVRAEITLRDDIDSFDDNGAYVEGYLFVSERPTADGAFGADHSIPVLGYYGGWGEPSMVDHGSYIDYQYDLEDKDPYMAAATALGTRAYSNAKQFIYYDNVFDGNYYLGGNPIGASYDDQYYPERNAISKANYLNSFLSTLIRNSAAYRFEVTDEQGAVIKEQEAATNSYAAYYYPSQGTWQNTTTNTTIKYDFADADEGERVNLSFSYAPEYFVDEQGNVDWDSVSVAYELPVVIDSEAPRVDSVIGKRIIETEETTDEEGNPVVNVTSNQIVLTVGASDNEYIAYASVMDEDGETLLEEGSRSGAKKTERDEEEYVVLVDGTNISDHLLVELFDYASNVTTVQVNLNKEELEGEVGITLDAEEVGTVVGSSFALRATVTPWGIADQSVTWSSSDNNVATVSDRGIVTGMAEGTAVITAAANADPSKTASCTVNVKIINRDLNGIVWDENGEVWFSSFNTATIPNYEKLSDPMRLPLASATYAEDGQLYSASFDSETWTSDLYTIDEQTYEAEMIGSSEIGYMDIAPAPSLGNDKLMAVYGPYAVIVNRTTGAYEGVFNLGTYTGDNYLVGIAYEEQYVHPTYGNTDWYFLLDDAGNVYYTGFLPYGGSYQRFGVQQLASLGYTTDTLYFQSFYFDGTDLYWSRFVDANNNVDIVFVEDFAGDNPSVYKLSAFPDGVWPIGGIYNDAVWELPGMGDHSGAVIDESAVFETEIAPVSRKSTVGKGSLNAIRDYGRLEHTADYDTDQNTVTIEITADDALQHNGHYEVYFDSSIMTFKSLTSSLAHTSWNDNGSGLITFGYIDKNGVAKDGVLATLTFEKDNDIETSLNVSTVQKEDDSSGDSQVFVIDEKFPVEELKVVDKLTLEKGDEYKLDVEFVPENATDKSLTFESSDPDVVEVDENGNLKANAEGTATITVTAHNGVTATVEVTVTVPVESIEHETEVTLYTNETYQLSVTVLPEDASDKSLTFTSANSRIAEVDENGVIKGLLPGETTVTITTSNGITGEVTVIVATPVESITISPRETIKRTNQQFTITVEVSPEDATFKDVTFRSLDPNIVSVDENGVVTTLSEGIATIVVSSVDNPQAEVACTIRVTNQKLTGWQKIGDSWFYYNNSGNLVKGWQKINGYWYFFGSDGVMYTGLRTIGSNIYFFGTSVNDGKMKTGWQKIGDYWYYFKGGDNGSAVKGWQKIGTYWYYFGNDGVMYTGFRKIGNNHYYFGSSVNDGKMKTGWQKIGDYWYYFKGGDSGAMVTGWLNVDQKWYYLQDDGKMLTGWLKYGNNWYYLKDGDSGAMLTGWQTINGKKYYFAPSGELKTPEEPED